MGYRLWVIGIGLLLSVAAYAEDSIAVVLPDTLTVDTVVPDTVISDTLVAKPVKPKKQIYYGTQLKFDILSPVLICGLHQWQMQHYEVAVNVRLARRWYPTMELGYAGGKIHNDSIQYNGQGGFMRVGCDINLFKKHPESPHAMLIGVRIGTAVQQFNQDCNKKASTTWENNRTNVLNTTGARADCWGEIVAGCQVEIAKVNNTAFYMGWMGRVKFLFTTTDVTHKVPLYVPGYGERDGVSWGANYYLGWRF